MKLVKWYTPPIVVIALAALLELLRYSALMGKPRWLRWLWKQDKRARLR